MPERKWYVGISVLISLFIISLITVVSITPLVFSQENEGIFTVSPGAFTARDVPPMGTPYIIPQNIVVWNRDNVERVVYITSEIPPENSITPGYESIPNENWVIPFPSSVVIKENSYALIQLSFNIPRWENLTGQKWEVWIPVERQPVLIDNTLEPVVLRPTVRMKIETTENLPPPTESEGINYLVLLALGLVAAIIIVGAWIWSKRRGRKKPGKGVFSQSRR